MKNSSDNFGNRTRDLPTCSVVPQPTAPPRAPNNKMYGNDTYADSMLQYVSMLKHISIVTVYSSTSQ